jgi:hypothetical protein
MLKARITSIAVATLLASAASVGWPWAPSARAEQIEGQRIIREIVVDGAVMEQSSDEAPANELRPTWIDHRSGLDQPYQHSWWEAVFFFPVFWTVYIPIVTIILAAAGEWLIHALRRLRSQARLAGANRRRARAVLNR